MTALPTHHIVKARKLVKLRISCDPLAGSKRLNFQAKHFESDSQENVFMQSLIAHELAHVASYSKGQGFVGDYHDYAYEWTAGKALQQYSTEEQGELVRGYFLSTIDLAKYKAGSTFSGLGAANVIGTAENYADLFK